MIESAPNRQPLPPPLDMSPEAIMQRLRMVGELNELCWFLGESELARKAAGQAGVPWRSPRLQVPTEFIQSGNGTIR
jgi:hypothetical protein